MNTLNIEGKNTVVVIEQIAAITTQDYSDRYRINIYLKASQNIAVDCETIEDRENLFKTLSKLLEEIYKE